MYSGLGTLSHSALNVKTIDIDKECGLYQVATGMISTVTIVFSTFILAQARMCGFVCQQCWNYFVVVFLVLLSQFRVSWLVSASTNRISLNDGGLLNGNDNDPVALCLRTSKGISLHLQPSKWCTSNCSFPLLCFGCSLVKCVQVGIGIIGLLWSVWVGWLWSLLVHMLVKVIEVYLGFSVKLFDR